MLYENRGDHLASEAELRLPSTQLPAIDRIKFRNIKRYLDSARHDKSDGHRPPLQKANASPARTTPVRRRVRRGEAAPRDRPQPDVAVFRVPFFHRTKA